MPPAVTTEEFLKAIWGSDDKGIAELMVLEKNGFVNALPFEWPAKLDVFLSAYKHANKTGNVFYGVFLRGRKWPYPTGKKKADGEPDIAKRGREDNTILGNAVFCEFDFYSPGNEQGHKGRVCLPGDAQEFLAKFPLRPSIVLKSGGGIQIFYLLREPVTGADVWKAKAINKALCEYFTLVRDGKKYGADPQAIDLARCLRIPNSLNHKYSPPRIAEISYWHPEHRYILDDFDFLPQESMKPAALGPSSDGTIPGERPLPTAVLPDAKITELTKLFSEIWSPADGLRHAMAMQVAGWLAFSGIGMESAKAVVAGASDSVGGDTRDRLNAVESTYDRFLNGDEVAGRPSLEKMINEDFPLFARPAAKKILEKIGQILPRKRPASDPGDSGPGGGGTSSGGGGAAAAGGGSSSSEGSKPDFDIVKIVKYDSRPARYEVTIRKHGESTDHVVPCEIEIYANITKFRTAFLEATENKFIAKIKQWRWEQMVSRAKLEVVKAPQEATMPGSIKAKLDAFIEERKENPELGELKSFPGYTDSEMFFQLDAFRRRLRDSGIRFTDREVTHVLRDEGWKDDRRWISNKNPRLWVKALIKDGGSNGNGHGNGGPPEPPKPVPAPTDAGAELPPSLFMIPESSPMEPLPSLGEPPPDAREPGEDVAEKSAVAPQDQGEPS